MKVRISSDHIILNNGAWLVILLKNYFLLISVSIWIKYIINLIICPLDARGVRV